MDEENDSTENKVSFKRPMDRPFKHNGRFFELFIRVEVEPNLDNPIYWTVILQFSDTLPETLEEESHNVAKIEVDKVHDGVHIHRNYRRTQPRDSDIDVNSWDEAIDYLESRCRRFFDSYADQHLY